VLAIRKDEVDVGEPPDPADLRALMLLFWTDVNP